MTARTAAWTFLSFIALYLGATRGHFISTDEVANYQTTRALWEEGSLAIPGDLSSAYEGRGGQRYAHYSVGPAIAAIPLYVAGKAARRLLEAAGLEDWVRTFAGPVIERPGGVRWGGEVEIFFVNLFNVFTTALLCSVFFVFSRRLGVSPHWALAATACLGITSYVAPFSTGFFQHSSEALLLLCSFYFLFRDARSPDWRARALAGVMAGLMLLARVQSVIALPALGLYLLHSVWRRSSRFSRHRLLIAARRAAPFVAPVAAGLTLHLWLNFVKWGELTLSGPYGRYHFRTPLLHGLYGLLLSPGESVLLFTPLLLLAPWALRHFARRYRAEALFVVVLSASYLVVHAKYEFWHAMWYFGPRFLVPLVPVLLLPMGPWMESKGRRAWLVMGPLCAIGLWVQLVHVAPNFWSVALHEGYIDFRPELGFLFIPELSPIVAHSEAFLAWDSRVDMWLVEVYRRFGATRTLALLLPLVALLSVGIRQTVRTLRDGAAALSPREMVSHRRRAVIAAAVVALAVLAAGFAATIDRRQRSRQAASQAELSDASLSFDAEIESGLDALQRGDNPRAIEHFTSAVALDPESPVGHLDLGIALLRAGRHDEALAVCERAVALAPDNLDTRHNLGFANRMVGRHAAAVELLEGVAYADGSRVVTWYELGMAYLALGARDQARAAFERVLALDSTHGAARARLSELGPLRETTSPP